MVNSVRVLIRNEVSEIDSRERNNQALFVVKLITNGFSIYIEAPELVNHSRLMIKALKASNVLSRELNFPVETDIELTVLFSLWNFS